MAGGGPADLFGQCEELLTAAQQALDTIPSLAPGLLGAPERAYVSPGTPALDCCDQLTVNAAPIHEAPTRPTDLGAGTRHRQDFRINYIGFQIYITRCGEYKDFPPPASALEAAAEQTNADAWALWNHLWNLTRAGELFSICSGVYFDGLAPLTPQGGCSGWVLTIRGELEGYET